jgi:hypothetical protein
MRLCGSVNFLRAFQLFRFSYCSHRLLQNWQDRYRIRINTMVQINDVWFRILPPGVGGLSRRFRNAMVSIFKGISVDG